MTDQLHDISVTLGTEAPAYPGDPVFERELVLSLERGDSADVSRISMCAHSGTHLDLPAHFFPGSQGAGEVDPGRFMLPARVLSVTERDSVDAASLAGLEPMPGEALLFRTRNSVSGLVRSGRFSEDYAYIEPGAAELCAGLGCCLVGLDYYSIDPFGSSDYPAHRILLGHGIPILEGIDLAGVPDGRYRLVCLPLRIAGAEASPVRAVLLS